LNIYTAVRGFISYQHAALTTQNEIKFANISGLDWVWVEILTVMMDWIGLGQ